MAQISIELRNIEEFRDTLSHVSTMLQIEIIEALEISGKFIEVDAKEMAPVKTGFMRSTIYTQVKNFVLYVGAWCYYARFQEYGTRYIKAVRFLGRAVQRRWPMIKDILHRAVRLACMEGK